MTSARQMASVFWLEQRFRQTRSPPTIAAVMQETARAFGVTPRDLQLRSRRQGIVLPRQAAMYFCDRYAAATVGEIGKVVNRHERSVYRGIRKIAERLGT